MFTLYSFKIVARQLELSRFPALLIKEAEEQRCLHRMSLFIDRKVPAYYLLAQGREWLEELEKDFCFTVHAPSWKRIDWIIGDLSLMLQPLTTDEGLTKVIDLGNTPENQRTSTLNRRNRLTIKNRRNTLRN